MIRSAVTISLVPEARGGPFVFWDDLADSCARAAGHGFEAVEIFPPGPGEVNPEKLHALLSRHGLRLAAVGSGAGWVKHKLSLTDPDASTRRRAIDFVDSLIGCVGPLGAPVIVGSMQGRWGNGTTAEQAKSFLAQALEELGTSAARHHTTLLYEPLNRYETNLFNRVEEASRFVRELRVENVLLLCDLFHMNLEEVDVAAALRVSGDRLGHVHFADSNRQAVGFGHIDILPIVQALEELNYQGYVSAEILPFPDSDTAARQSMSSFRRWFPRSKP